MDNEIKSVFEQAIEAELPLNMNAIHSQSKGEGVDPELQMQDVEYMFNS